MRIRELRESLGLTRVQLADALKVSKMAAYKWEHGLAYPSADKLPDLARALHCTIDALYDQNQTSPAERSVSCISEHPSGGA